MTSIFVVKNQIGQYLNKHQEWVDGSDSQTLFRTPHRDEAINTVFEVSSRDIYLRAEAIACELDSKGQPLVDAALNTAPQADADPTDVPSDELSET